MTNEQTLKILRKCVNVLQGNYTSTAECKKDIEDLLNEIDDLHLVFTGERLVKRGTITEALSNGLHSPRKRIDYNKS